MRMCHPLIQYGDHPTYSSAEVNVGHIYLKYNDVIDVEYDAYKDQLAKIMIGTVNM